MSFIDFMWDSYKTLPKIYFLELGGQEVKFRELLNYHMGVYDPDWGMETEVYEAGKFPGYYGETGYYDEAYNNKQGLLLVVKHRKFGIYPQVLQSFSQGHFHYLHIVSTNIVRPQDVMFKSPTGDVLFCAILARNPPTTSPPDEYGNEHTIIEITPTLSPDDITKLSKNAGFISKIKADYVEATSERERLKIELFQQTALTKNGAATILLLQNQFNTLLTKYQITLEKVNNMGIHIEEQLQARIDGVEGDYNLGLPNAHLDLEDTDRTAAMYRSEIRSAQALLKSNGSLSDNEKTMLVLQVGNVVGFDFMRKVIAGSDQYPARMGNGNLLTISKSPNPIELIQQKAEQVTSGDISLEEFTGSMKQFIEDLDKSAKKSGINSATMDKRKELVASQAPEEQQGIRKN